MTVKLSTGLRNLLAGTTGLAAALTDGVIFIYSGAQPLSPDNPPSGTPLGIVTKDGGAWAPGSPENGLEFDPAVGGTVTKKAADSWKFSGSAVGTAGWFRFVGNAADNGAQSVTAVRMDGSIGTTGADLNLSNIAIIVGAPSTVDQFTFTIPAQ
jgi:hypothetical protein